MHKAEPFFISKRPFKIVQQRPGEIAAHRNAFICRAGDCLYMVVQIGQPQIVTNLAIDHNVIAGHAVLGNVDRNIARIAASYAFQCLIKTVGIYLPPHLCAGQ